MTLSVLTFNKKTGVFAAAAATGNLCVGGWVLRGDIESGLVASQGTSPSTFWRDDIIRRLRATTTTSRRPRSRRGRRSRRPNGTAPAPPQACAAKPGRAVLATTR